MKPHQKDEPNWEKALDRNDWARLAAKRLELLARMLDRRQNQTTKVTLLDTTLPYSFEFRRLSEHRHISTSIQMYEIMGRSLAGRE